ncbi:hypothetical protein KQX54_016452 [Cotesia glomerata]|uniref:Uncharacterized protein n=1 Tax=Cotesia glomerata TaxID=32391 RepID=A0AAV7IE92_COTGL|nr:hypothetical protein KQX54_016452 [Cotesia glomerata]
MKVEDVEDLNGRYLVTINDNKNDYLGQFLIGNLFYPIVKKYIALRRSDFEDDFDVNAVEPISTEIVVNSGFTTASKKPTSVPIKTQKNLENNNDKTPFMDKPRVKLTFPNQPRVQPLPAKKKKNDCLNTSNPNKLDLT